MSEIRCPMCGKNNPDQLEKCQYCQARLTPFFVSGDDADRGDSGLPDWMKSEFEDQPSSTADAEPEDWLAGLRPEADSPDDEDAAPFDDSGDDWLGRMRGFDDEDDADESEDESSIFDGKLPEWMSVPEAKEPPAAPEPDPAAEDAMLDWLSKLDSGNQAAAPPAAESEELPDWMLNFDSNNAPEAESTPEIPAASPEPDPELPDWLTHAAPAVESASPALESDGEALPDWMFSADNDQPESASIPDESQPAPAGDGLPDWMSKEFAAEKFDDGLPDWMSGQDDPDHAAALSTILPDTSPLMPEWPTDFESDSKSAVGIGADLTPSDEFEPDWLETLGAGTSAESFELEAPTLESELSNADNDLFALDALSDAFSDSYDADEPPADDLAAPADLPDWLQAMRPVESSAAHHPTEHGPIEQTGPLAGLSGVLMAEPEIARLKKAPTFTSKLEITPAQQEHVRIFTDLLNNEGTPKFTREPIHISTQNLLRWVSALLLIFVVALGVMSESQTVPPPSGVAIPAEMLHLADLIEALAPTDPVLVSFDFEPGTSGEMNAASAAVIDHLMLKGAYLSLVSTSPTGPALAEYFIHTIQSEHGYTSGIQYTNLGYIPGGASGLLGFVQMPSRITPLSFDGMEAWQTPALSGIQSLADYKLVLLITDNPDTARTWLEQVQPYLQDTPLIAVVSAQAEPILHPYASGPNAQLSGLISGLNGGAAYEQVIGKPNLARVYWDTLNYALMAAVIVLLIGVAANLMSHFTRKKTPGEAT